MYNISHNHFPSRDGIEIATESVGPLRKILRSFHPFCQIYVSTHRFHKLGNGRPMNGDHPWAFKATIVQVPDSILKSEDTVGACS